MMHGDSRAWIKLLRVTDNSIYLGHDHHFPPWNLILVESFAKEALRLAVGINIGSVPLLAVSSGVIMLVTGVILTVLIPRSYAAFNSGSAYFKGQ